jgi:hypothetical protein
LLAASDAVRDRFLAASSLLLADIEKTAGATKNARDTLDASLAALPAILRPALFRKLAEVDCAEGLPHQAGAHAADAFVLAHPFQELPESLPGACGSPPSAEQARRREAQLLDRLETISVTDASGQPRTLRFPADRSRLLVFWSADCGWSKLEVQRLLALIHDPESPLVKHTVDLIWVNNDPSNRKADALAWARDTGLELSAVVFPGSGTSLAERLRVAGTPALFLVTPDGLVAWGAQGFESDGWAPAVERILSAWAPATAVVR